MGVSAAPQTMADVLGALDHPERGLTFLESARPRFLSFAELGRATADLAERWAGLGLRPGERVVVIVGEEYSFALAFLSALRAGVVPVPLFPPVTFGQLDAYARTVELQCRLGEAQACLVTEALVDLAAKAVPAQCRVLTFKQLAQASVGAVQAPSGDDPAYVQFSSGTTGTPQGALVTHRALLADTSAIVSSMGCDPATDRPVSWLPMYHDMGLVGLLLAPLLLQMSSWYMSPLAFARDPVRWLEVIGEVRGTISFAPNFAYDLVARRVGEQRLAALDLRSWRIAGCGAEPIDCATLRAFARRFASAGFAPGAVMASYGLAEATLAVTLASPGGGLRSLAVDAAALEERAQANIVAPEDAGRVRTTEVASCGVPIGGVLVEVVDGDGRPLPEDREGEIVVGGPILADGYVGDPEASATAWRDGWLHTGDRGFLHAGELYLTGRIKDLIIVHGRNLHPQQLEAIAGEVPGVRSGAVVALAARAGDTVGVALVCEISAESRADADQIVREVRRAVHGAFGVPVLDVVLIPRGRVPRTTSGKLRRTRTGELLDSLRRQGWEWRLSR